MDTLRPVTAQVNFMDGVHLAMAPAECDAVYVVTAGLPRRGDPDYFLKRVYTLNVREVAFHVIGVECEPADELALRRLTEENHGTFRHKRFESNNASWAPMDNDDDER